MSSFAALFAGHLSEMPTGLGQAEIVSLALSPDRSKLQLVIHPPQLLAKGVLFAACRQLQQSLQLERLELKLRYQPEQFSPAYLPELVAELRHRGLPVNGFFEDATLTLADGCLLVQLAHGGAALLEKSGCPAQMQRILQEEFNMHCRVELQEQPGAKPAKRRLSATVQARQPIPPASKPASTAALKSKAKANPQDVKGIPFTVEKIHILRGKAVRGSPVALAEVTPESGTVVVWGKIFSAERKQSRDGTKFILSFCITDYTSSNVLKLILEKREAAALECLDTGSIVLVR